MAKSPIWQWPASITLLERMTSSPSRQSWRDMRIGEKGAALADDRLARRRRPCPGSSSPLRGSGNPRRSSSATGSPRYLRSCGSMADRSEGKDARARADARCRRRRRHARSARTPSPSVASAPTWQNGPIVNARAELARRVRRRRWDGQFADTRRQAHSFTSIAETSASQTARRRPSPRRGTTTCCGAWRCASCETRT